MSEYFDAWGPEVEAANLAKRFEGVNQAAFARRVNFPGGPSMINQHIKGRRPLNLQHAVAYAAGFGVQLEDISPRLARQAANAFEVREASPLQYVAAHSFGTGKTGNLVKLLAEGNAEMKAITILTSRLQAHSATRREIIGGLLQKLANQPDNAALIEELELQLHAPQQTELATESVAPSSTFGSTAASAKARGQAR